MPGTAGGYLVLHNATLHDVDGTTHAHDGGAGHWRAPWWPARTYQHVLDPAALSACPGLYVVGVYPGGYRGGDAAVAPASWDWCNLCKLDEHVAGPVSARGEGACAPCAAGRSRAAGDRWRPGRDGRAGGTANGAGGARDGAGDDGDGVGPAATFSYPWSVSYSPDGAAVAVADSSNYSKE